MSEKVIETTCEVREITIDDLQESMEAFIGYRFEQSRGLARAISKLGTIRIKESK